MRFITAHLFPKQVPLQALNPLFSTTYVSTTCRAILQFPEFIDYFIKYKEEHGEDAESLASAKVAWSKQLYLQQFKALANLPKTESAFYETPGDTYEEAYQRAQGAPRMLYPSLFQRFRQREEEQTRCCSKLLPENNWD